MILDERKISKMRRYSDKRSMSFGFNLSLNNFDSSQVCYGKFSESSRFDQQWHKVQKVGMKDADYAGGRVSSYLAWTVLIDSNSFIKPIEINSSMEGLRPLDQITFDRQTLSTVYTVVTLFQTLQLHIICT